MLKSLEINNIALISKVLIEFDSKLNVLSGETGAGKSIIVDALNFVIGAKGQKNLIKQGENFMKVQAIFSGNFSQDVKDFFKQNDIELDGEIFISRKLTIDGKNDCRLNGSIIPLNLLKSLTSMLIDIHGQHEHQSILNEKNHLKILDGFIKDKSCFVEYQERYNKLLSLNGQIKKLNGSQQNQERILDLLNYQINEIESVKIQKDEDEVLTQKRLVMLNSEKIYDAFTGALESLDEQNSVSDKLKQAANQISYVTKFDEKYEGLIERINSCKFEILDIIEALKQERQGCDFDQNMFDEIDQRLDRIKVIKKKYGPTLEDVFCFLDKAKKDYEEILGSKEKLQVLLKEKQTLLQNTFDAANKISNLRKEAAKNFENKVENELVDLGMKSARFKVQFKENNISTENCEDYFNQNGFDDVKFLFSANAGQSLRPLSEIISGGEASRFMLAVKNILADLDNIDSMVFDEIDTGISGDIGFVVAMKMQNIANKHQVMAISHLPQICAMADYNIKVLKTTKNDQTDIGVYVLSKDEKLDEIARLSGGAKNSVASLEHAKELNKRCLEYKQNIR